MSKPPVNSGGPFLLSYNPDAAYQRPPRPERHDSEAVPDIFYAVSPQKEILFKFNPTVFD